ncbi:hypothetical protein B0H34DRAFT_678153 [Crassisporium funariophilum]|nr:hypothetical protein B0H34DRAFT_678153 [Crassisporium funariophilum]
MSRRLPTVSGTSSASLSTASSFNKMVVLESASTAGLSAPLYTDKDKIYQELMCTQVEVGRLIAENKTLCTENTELILKNARYQKQKGKNTAGDIDEEASILLKIIGKLVLQSKAAELNVKLYQFRNGMSATRSKLIQYIRKVAPAVLDISSNYFSSKATNNFENNARGRGLVTQAPVFNPFPSLLFKDFVQEEEFCFLNKAFIKIGRRVIFGKTATDCPEKAIARANNMVPQPDVPPESTIEMIAMIAMLTEFVLTNDPSLSDSFVGDKSKIDYQKKVELYRGWIQSAKVKDPDWAEDLFTTYNLGVFSKQLEQEKSKHSASRPTSPPLVDPTPLASSSNAEDSYIYASYSNHAGHAMPGPGSPINVPISVPALMPPVVAAPAIVIPLPAGPPVKAKPIPKHGGKRVPKTAPGDLDIISSHVTDAQEITGSKASKGRHALRPRGANSKGA